MDFRILRPLEVYDEGRRIDIGARASAVCLVKTLRAYVSRLRGALAGGDAAANGGRLETRGSRYLLRVEPGELDSGPVSGVGVRGP